MASNVKQQITGFKKMVADMEADFLPKIEAYMDEDADGMRTYSVFHRGQRFIVRVFDRYDNGEPYKDFDCECLMAKTGVQCRHMQKVEALDADKAAREASYGYQEVA